ncbi:type IV pilus biogenesis/stability protein PilW [Steroidobacter agaridevorans]|uniref:Type IV pilus biogenesis/stability protein PilW n=1 Tax=Steroidobacter agaridevorans TaxID=2695856 RepID=A0A829YBP4_9GAMM|nr:type IV pilus biogenesis/stability protein PilW [Steroidobacter agaridevorans]GFE80373.1 type IV pilus biogenesis/stability protein PilW [Steroidobacter agaridevorans]GFE87429.1 type IV pilus biogenesis/stability protein PilW [Steroidobacter agaridevorans]
MRSTAVAFLVLSAALAGCVSTGSTQLGSPDNERAAEINLQIGTDYLRKNNLNQAKEKIDKAVEQNPRNSQAQITAGMLYERLGESDKAESHFAKGLALDPKNPEVQNNYGAFLCQRGKHSRGEKLMIEAATNPLYRTPEVAYLNAANCARNGGDLKGAETNLRKALAVRPKFGEALFQMADLQYKQTDYLSARGFLERYIEVGRTSPASLWLGVRIERGLGNVAAAKNYAERLKLEYPRAAQTKELIESERNPG